MIVNASSKILGYKFSEVLSQMDLFLSFYSLLIQTSHDKKSASATQLLALDTSFFLNFSCGATRPDIYPDLLI